MLNSHYDGDPERYAHLRDSWLSTHRLDFVAETLRSARPGDRVLEIGSGTGNLLTALARRRPDLTLIGTEPLANYVEYAASQAAAAGVANVTYQVGTGESVEPADLPGPVQWIVSNDTLHHVEDIELCARRLAAVADRGARWLATEPSVLNPYMALMHLVRAGERNFRVRPFVRAAARHGWTVQGKRYLFLIPSAVARPPSWAQAAERRFERVPVLGAGVGILLARSG
jgi:SAM-dependent methyltransferase